MSEDLKERLKKEAEALGFRAFGVAHPDAAPETAARLRAWLSDGCHGGMLWMETHADRRVRPRALWPEVRSLIMLGLSYAPALDPLRHAGRPDHGTISVYALGQDYHDVLKPRLKTLARWLIAQAGEGTDAKVFVDTAPLMEKPLAEAAGIGWQGKHTNLVSRADGSWLFLAAILTTIPLPPDPPARDRCGSCAACQTACPTNAFPAPYRLDARRCISYLTIEHRGPIPAEFRAAIGNRIYGCDDCLAVCPWNKFAAQARELAFSPRAELVAPRLADLLALDDADFRQVFAGSPVKRVGRDRLVRNACIAAGNSGNSALIPRLKALASDPDAGVSEAASWAVRQLEAAP